MHELEMGAWQSKALTVVCEGRAPKDLIAPPYM